ncbi:HNMT methyltransferase, partial [Rhinopomastus cyanomelas]|nr:HNMT methyltransferase [Rhinopomastus cyanomelas]
MASPIRTLASDLARYVQAFNVFLANSTEHQSTQKFIEKELPAVIASIGNGKSTINVLSVGGGAGETDLLILSKIRARYPEVTINNEVIEPSAEQILKYKEHVAKTSNLKNINFTWHEETATEYISRMKAEKKSKKWDFIHMIQVLYYVKDIPATFQYFHSILDTHAKLLIIVLSETSDWETLWRKYGSSFIVRDVCTHLSSVDIKKILDPAGLTYQIHEIPSHLDITSCFIEGNEDGELLLDFLTQVCEFSKTAPPELKCQVMEDLRKHACSEKRDGKVFFKTNISAIVIEP